MGNRGSIAVSPPIACSGLGFAISKKLCQFISGSINVISVQCQGSCFQIKLPLIQSATTKCQEKHKKLKSVKLLFAEKSKVLLHTHRRYLEGFGVEAHTAEDAHAVIKACQEQSRDKLFYICLFGKNLGQKIAVELAKQLKAHAITA